MQQRKVEVREKGKGKVKVKVKARARDLVRLAVTRRRTWSESTHLLRALRMGRRKVKERALLLLSERQTVQQQRTRRLVA